VLYKSLYLKFCSLEYRNFGEKGEEKKEGVVFSASINIEVASMDIIDAIDKPL